MISLILSILLLVASAAHGQAISSGPRVYRPSAKTGQSIASAVTAARHIGARVYVPAGSYKVSKTLDWTALGPIRIEGEVLSGEYAGNVASAGSVELVWTGTPGGTMVRLNGYGVQIGNLTLNGNGRAGKGILLTNEPKGGTSQNRLYDVHLHGFSDVAMQAGETADDKNASDFFFERVNLSRSKTGFRVVHIQGVSYAFRDCSFGLLETAIHVKNSGGVLVDGGGTAAIDLFLQLENLSRHGGNITVNHVRFEADGHTTAWMQLVDSDWSAARIVFNGIRLAGGKSGKADDGKPIAHVRTSNVLVFRDSELIQERNAVIKAEGNHHGYARVVLDNTVGIRVERNEFAEVVER